jgi:hypothetical protein
VGGAVWGWVAGSSGRGGGSGSLWGSRGSAGGGEIDLGGDALRCDGERPARLGSGDLNGGNAGD